MNLNSFCAALSPKHFRDLARNFRNHHWDRNDDGDILISHARISGMYETFCNDGLGGVKTPNLITTEGANYLISCGVAGGVAYGTFYVAPFSGNITVVDTITAATFASAATEISTYAESTRVAFVESVPASKSSTNTANPSVFTASADNISVWGAGLLSSATKLSTAGVLLSIAKYSSARSLATTGDTLGVKYTLSLSNA